MTIKHFIVLFSSICLLGACTKGNVRTASAQVTSSAVHGIKNGILKRDYALELLYFIDQYSNLAPDMQKKLFAETNQQISENKNYAFNRLKLASMLSLPSSRMRDNAKAQTLLQELLQGNTLSSAEYSLISLLYEYTTDNGKQQQRNREDAKKLESVQLKYEALELKTRILEQKLNELKNIEKTMNERDSKPSN